MRIVYTTPRLENAEQVAAMLEQGGVPVRVLFGPHFRRNTWRGANYRQGRDSGNWPRVMVVNNGDLPEARRLLREAGLLDPPAFERNGASARAPTTAASAPAATGRRMPSVRWLLMAAVAIVAVVQGVRFLT